MLLCSPNYLNEASLPLCVSGEPESQPLAFSKPCTLWASPANAGALDLANELAAAFTGLTISTADARPATATHMLLYLNEDSFSDERLAEQVKQARQDRLKIVMAHENDPALGGCQFSRFFEVTPQERMSQRGACPATPPPQPSPPQRRRSSSPADSTRTWQNPASPATTARRAPSPPQRALPRIERFVTRGGSLPAGVARPSGKEPRRDPRSVAGGPPRFRQRR